MNKVRSFINKFRLPEDIEIELWARAERRGSYCETCQYCERVPMHGFVSRECRANEPSQCPAIIAARGET